ncbi:MAG: hypothetical protein QW548_01175 [Candidatus Aenigmatarchaeota archaeon]
MVGEECEHYGAEEQAPNRSYSILEIARLEPLLICDSSVNGVGNALSSLYELRNYGRMNGEIAEAMKRSIGSISDFIGALREDSVKVTDEVYAEIRRGLEILGDKQRYLNSATGRSGRRSRKGEDINYRYGKQLVDGLSSAWYALAEACKRKRLAPSDVCRASVELVMYMEGVMRLKAGKPQHSEANGNCDDLRTDERLLGMAIGKALEGQPAAIATRDADFCYMMPIYSSLIMCPELDEPWLARRLREKPVTLYKAGNDSATYTRVASTADIKACGKFVARSLSERDNRIFKCNVKKILIGLRRLLGSDVCA